MASIFVKSDSKDKSVKRWAAKVKIGDEWKTVSLRLLVKPGLKREARQRAVDLQQEIRAGSISESTRAWLGDEATGRVLGLIEQANSGGPKSTPGAHGEANVLAVRVAELEAKVATLSHLEARVILLERPLASRLRDRAHPPGLPRGEGS